MLSESGAREFAAEWIAAWNAHDLERILGHYTDDFEMQSPFILTTMGVTTGSLKGKAAVRPYWQRALAAQPLLRFELRDILVGVDTIALYYLSTTRNRMVAEVLRFNAEGRVVWGAGLYGGAPH
jgi:ketosteroid isomerase-like protein